MMSTLIPAGDKNIAVVMTQMKEAIMATIESTIDKDHQMVIHNVTGEISFDEIVRTVKSFNDPGPSKLILWDFSGASLTRLTPDHVEALAILTNQYASLRTGGKTAFVVSSDLEFGYGRMYETHHEILSSGIPHRTFWSRETALKWLLDEQKAVGQQPDVSGRFNGRE